MVDDPNPERQTHTAVNMPSKFRHISKKLKKLKNLTKKGLRSRSTADHEGETTQRRCLLELPTELLLEIISNLTEVSQACLALTCKRLFAVSRPILSSKALRFNRDFPQLFRHYQDQESFGTARWQLLTTLEDGKWRACSKCLKLHPRNTFSSRQLKRKPENRTCSLGDLAGIVDLCPCKKLTFRDKLELVALLQTRREVTKALASTGFGSRMDEPYCWHSCTERYGSTELKIDIFPELDEKDTLLIRTEYQLLTGPGQLATEEHITARFGCAHRSVDLWFSSVCQTTICQLHESLCGPCKSIMVCGCCNTTLRCTSGRHWSLQNPDRIRYSFWTQRCLGGPAPVPDKVWAAQRIHPAGPLVSLHISNELCPWAIRQHPPLTWPPSLGMQILFPAMNDEPLSQLYYSIHMI